MRNDWPELWGECLGTSAFPDFYLHFIPFLSNLHIQYVRNIGNVATITLETSML